MIDLLSFGSRDGAGSPSGDTTDAAALALDLYVWLAGGRDRGPHLYCDDSANKAHDPNHQTPQLSFSSDTSYYNVLMAKICKLNTIGLHIKRDYTNGIV